MLDSKPILKFMALILSIAIIAGMTPVLAFAEGDDAIPLEASGAATPGVTATPAVTATSAVTLKSAIDDFNSSASEDTTIVIGDDFAINSLLQITNTSYTLTIKSDGTTRTLTRGVIGNLFTVATGAKLVMENIVIDGGRNGSYSSGGGGSLVRINGGTFTMNDGAVLQNNYTTGNGGGVYFDGASGTFIMNGGKISGNRAGTSGGGVYFYGSGSVFTMNNGEISGNTGSAMSGAGGVSAGISNGTITFTMNGGKISGNSGGGVDNSSLNGARGQFIMYGGEISGNTGYGVNVTGSNSIFTVGGTAVIKNNTATTGAPKNLSLGSGRYITLGTNANAPASEMEIWVTKTADSGVFVNTGATAGNAQYFRSDDPAKLVEYTSGQLKLAAKAPASIAVTTPPAKTTYIAGESFSSTGMVVTASYADGSSAAVTGYTVTPSGALSTSDTSVTISYTGGGITTTTTQAITVNKKTQTRPTITGGNITKKYGDANFIISATGGESSGGYVFSSSNANVATINANTGLVTLGTGANAIGSTNITVKKLGDDTYSDSAESTAITLTVNKADQAPPTIAYERSGDPATGVTVTITSPSSAVAEFSKDNFITTEASNVITFPAGTESATIYARLKATATHEASQAAHELIEFSKLDQAAPPEFTMTYAYDSGSNTFTVTIPEVAGAEYSFDDITYSQTRTTTANPGDEVEGFMRYPATATHNASPAVSSLLTLPVPVTSITVTGVGGADSITTNGGTLQMLAEVEPSGATQAVAWSVSGTGATISESGLLTATADGTVTVRATATDGSGVYGEKAIIISGQTTGGGTTPSVPVTSITVSGTGGANSITTKNGTLQMLADVQPSNADNKAVAWTVSGTGATISASGLLTATADGTVTVRATAADGSGVYGEKAITISGQTTGGGTMPSVPVTSITVSGTGGANSITTKNGTLQMLADVQPSNADNKAVAWTVSGTGATISASGLLTATANGTVTVRATATDGSGVYGEKAITISGQTTGGGSSGSGGGSGGGSSSSGRSGGSTSTVTTTPAATWLNTPTKDGAPSKSSGQAGVKAADWKKLGKTSYTHDTMGGKNVQVRVTINDPSQFKKDTLLSGYVKGKGVDNTLKYFEKWFKNKVRAIHFDQQTDWEQPVRVAAKVDLKSMDTSNLIFYSYDAKTNSYRQIKNPNYYIDANGYLWFTTQFAGEIVISAGTLEKK